MRYLAAAFTLALLVTFLMSFNALVLPTVEAAPAPTSTPSPAPTAVPVAPTPAPDNWETIRVRYSWYNPALGGPNCAYFAGGECLSNMASGEPWKPWMGRAVACPREWSFRTLVKIDGRIFLCMDRGGKIVYDRGIPWIDTMLTKPLYPYGSIIQVDVCAPGDC